MTESINKAIEDPTQTAKNAVNMYDAFRNLGEDILRSAIPQSHYGIDKNQKEAIEFYLNKMNELDLGNLYGGTLPDEGFYYSI